jgi:hypothetical protein
MPDCVSFSATRLRNTTRIRRSRESVRNLGFCEDRLRPHSVPVGVLWEVYRDFNYIFESISTTYHTVLIF